MPGKRVVPMCRHAIGALRRIVRAFHLAVGLVRSNPAAMLLALIATGHRWATFT
jgi:hypothetical protein